ncbi:IS110 family transposase [Rhodohalobacter sp.]|uniref:IS110 family transposase n=1 Tax=Rhodohalobacter sp. TaxID=1974210 RepID=UPI002ACD9303|nr:transposase [Rhodohalobacter sp.]MDZ7757452.1 transposase [Rhodohalobacter sp.]
MELTITWRFVVGIDISKQCLDCYLLDRKTTQGWDLQVDNNPEGFARLGRWLDDRQVECSQTILISEHTGRYGEHLLRWTTCEEWAHAVVKTTALNKITPEHHRKDDRYDARALADYGVRFSDRLSLSKAPSPAMGQLKRLQGERRKMVDRRAALKSKLTEADIHDADMDQLTGMWTQQINLLSQHIKRLEETMDELISQDEALTARHQIMRTAPGIGPVIGRFWLSLFTGEDQLNARKISSRFGFAPHGRSSGSSVKSPDRSTGYGNSEMRKLMHQAARSVANHKPHYREYYERKIEEGKHELLVINNIINKLIRLYCAMWNNQSEYDPNYIQNMKQKWKKSA